MAQDAAAEPKTRGYRKREKTRAQLIDAGERVLARKGEALTVSDVVAEADVSNGTFYNYFRDREELVEVLAEQLLLSLAATAAAEPIEDPALRFAVASARVLKRAEEDPSWGRVVVRLVERPEVHDGVTQYLREDLAAGHASGRFETGPDDATLDQVMGLLWMTMRRMLNGKAGPETPRLALERALRALGVSSEEASSISREALTL
ncbi:MAG: helix-turn-helix domain-containing protein [Myxococcota bacterium]|nr:helix-turn-helix domain-containing protein [Myxococcota bacterium]